MSKITIKTIWGVTQSQDEVDCFDGNLEDCLNDGYEIIGNIRTVEDVECNAEVHFATLKKVI